MTCFIAYIILYLSFRNPNTGFLNTATRSELDVSGARSPTKMEYSLCCSGDEEEEEELALLVKEIALTSGLGAAVGAVGAGKGRGSVCES